MFNIIEKAQPGTTYFFAPRTNIKFLFSEKTWGKDDLYDEVRVMRKLGR